MCEWLCKPFDRETQRHGKVNGGRQVQTVRNPVVDSFLEPLFSIPIRLMIALFGCAGCPAREILACQPAPAPWSGHMYFHLIKDSFIKKELLSPLIRTFRSPAQSRSAGAAAADSPLARSRGSIMSSAPLGQLLVDFNPSVRMLYVYAKRMPFRYHSKAALERWNVNDSAEIVAMDATHWIPYECPDVLYQYVHKYLKSVQRSDPDKHVMESEQTKTQSLSKRILADVMKRRSNRRANSK